MIVEYYQTPSDQLYKDSERPLPEGVCMTPIPQFRRIDQQTKSKLTPDSKRPTPHSSRLTWSGLDVKEEAELSSD